MCVLSLTIKWLCKCCVLLELCGQSSYKLNQSDIVTYYFPCVVETALQARAKTTWYGGCFHRAMMISMIALMLYQMFFCIGVQFVHSPCSHWLSVYFILAQLH